MTPDTFTFVVAESNDFPVETEFKVAVLPVDIVFRVIESIESSTSIGD